MLRKALTLPEQQVNPPRFPLIIAGNFSEVRGYHTVRPSGTQDWLMIATLDGSGFFGYGDGVVVSQPGDIMLLAPGTPHDYGVKETPGHWKLLWAHFHARPHWFDWLDWPSVHSKINAIRLNGLPEHDRIIERFFDVYSTTLSDEPQREALAMNLLERMLIDCRTINPIQNSSRADPRVEAVRNYIAGNIAEPISTLRLAQVSGLSVSRISHLFTQKTGLTPQQFWEQQRMVRAQQLLNLTDRSVVRVAEDVGFENPYYFSNRFKKVTGQSPTEYRRRVRSY